MQLPFYHSPYFLLGMANFFWSLNFIIGKLVGTAMPPATVSFFRWGVPLLIFLSFCWRDIKANQVLYRRHWLLLTVLGTSGYCINSVTVYYAVLHTSVINTSFINAFNPVLIALAGFFCYHYPLTKRQMMGFLVAFAGVVWIVFKGDPSAIFALRINSGDMAMLLNVSIWTVHTLLYKKYGSLFPKESFFAVMILAGVAVTTPLMIIENLQDGTAWMAQFGWQHVWGLLALSVFPSVLAYRFWNEALSRVSTSKAAISQYLIPVYTVLISLVFLGEQIQNYQMLGGALIFIGVLLAVLQQKN